VGSNIEEMLQADSLRDKFYSKARIGRRNFYSKARISG